MQKYKRCLSCSAGILCKCRKSEKEKSSNVDHPDHYLSSSGHEVIDVIEAWHLDFNLGNAIKYIARAGKKSPEKKSEDLQKAIWYINRNIQKSS